MGKTIGWLGVMVSVAMLAGCKPNLARVQEEAASARSEFPGTSAPDFALADQNGKIVHLSDLRGRWVVLYFYPKDDTPGCTCQATEFTDLIVEFRSMNVPIYGISADTPEMHRTFIAKYELAIDLLSDVDHAVMAKYGAWVLTTLGGRQVGRVIRSTVAIDPQGIVRYHWPEVIPQGHADRVRWIVARLEAGGAASRPDSPKLVH